MFLLEFFLVAIETQKRIDALVALLVELFDLETCGYNVRPDLVIDGLVILQYQLLNEFDNLRALLRSHNFRLELGIARLLSRGDAFATVVQWLWLFNCRLFVLFSGVEQCE